MLRALIFDVDGTLADTESAHRAAFNQAFAELGLGWEWDEALYTELLNISGGKERILHYWRLAHPDIKTLNGQALQDTIARIHELKTAAYERAINDGAVALRPGVLRLMDEAMAQGLQLAAQRQRQPVRESHQPDGLAQVGKRGLLTLAFVAQHRFEQLAQLGQLVGWGSAGVGGQGGEAGIVAGGHREVDK